MSEPHLLILIEGTILLKRSGPKQKSL